jgi:tetratricopeptide (TPR) repeat protein
VTIIINSLTRLNNKNDAFSLGILFLIGTTWLIGTLLFAVETENQKDIRTWLQSFGIMAITSLVIGGLFFILHAVSLEVLENFTVTNQNDFLIQVNSIGSLLTKYYLYIFIVFAIIAYLLPDEWPSRNVSPSYIGVLLVPIALILILIGTNISNLKVIHADVTFKMAEPFTKNGQWEVATFLYKEALKLASNEDHYYLFLGRSYLEQAKITDTTTDQDSLVSQAEKDLLVAQAINPLNTDHTANLARLYSWWAGKATTTEIVTERAQKASEYYETAVTLSPNNSTLWDEWGILYLQVIGQAQQAMEKFQLALSLDAKYSYTQGLLGDYFLKIGNSLTDTTAKQQAFLTAEDYYQTAAKVAKSADPISKASYLVSLSNVYVKLASLDPENIDRKQIQQAIDVLLESIDAGISSSDQWKVQEAIAKLYYQLGDKTNTQYYANLALTSAPTTVTSRIQDLITQSLTLP